MFNFATKKKRCLHKTISSVIALAFFVNLLIPVPSFSQTLNILPTPGALAPLSSSYNPVLLSGIRVYPENPLQFDFIVNDGDDNAKGKELKAEAEKMIKYFLAALTAPEEDLWVNLSPYEQDRIIADELAQTDIGRDLLAQDYILKQITASLIYPEDELGKRFWDRIYKKSYEKYGTTDIPVDTFNKVWIMPNKVSVYENGNMVFVAEASLKVMLEQDYLALQESDKSQGVNDNEQLSESSKMASDIVREIVLPELEKEINQGKNFASLRQIYHSLILATWFKKALKKSLLGQIYVDKNKFQGLGLEEKNIKEKIYQQYLKAYQKGVYDYVKPEYDQYAKRNIPRKYFSGGIAIAKNTREKLENVALPTGVQQRYMVKDGDNVVFQTGLAKSGSSVLRITMADGTKKIIHIGDTTSDNSKYLRKLRDGRQWIGDDSWQKKIKKIDYQKRFRRSREQEETVKNLFGIGHYSYYYGNQNVMDAIGSGKLNDFKVFDRVTLKPIKLNELRSVVGASQNCALHIIKDERIALLSSSNLTLNNNLKQASSFISIRQGDIIKGSLGDAFERIHDVYKNFSPVKLSVDYGEDDDSVYNLDQENIYNLPDAVDILDGAVVAVEIHFTGAKILKIQSIEGGKKWEVVSVRSEKRSSSTMKTFSAIRKENLEKLRDKIPSMYQLAGLTISKVQEILGKPDATRILVHTTAGEVIGHHFFDSSRGEVSFIEFQYTWGIFKLIKPMQFGFPWTIEVMDMPTPFDLLQAREAQKIVIPSFADDVLAKEVYEAVKKAFERKLTIEKVSISEADSGRNQELDPDAEWPADFNVEKFSLEIQGKGNIVFLKKKGSWNLSVISDVPAFKNEVKFEGREASSSLLPRISLKEDWHAVYRAVAQAFPGKTIDHADAILPDGKKIVTHRALENIRISERDWKGLRITFKDGDFIQFSKDKEEKIWVFEEAQGVEVAIEDRAVYKAVEKKTHVLLNKLDHLLQTDLGSSLSSFAKFVSGKEIVVYEMIREFLQNLKVEENFFDPDLVEEMIDKFVAAISPENGIKPRAEIASFGSTVFPFMVSPGKDIDGIDIDSNAAVIANQVYEEKLFEKTETGYLVFSSRGIKELFKIDPNASEISFVVGSDVYERRNRGKTDDDTNVTAKDSLERKAGWINLIRELEQKALDDGLRENLDSIRIRFYLSASFGFRYKVKDQQLEDIVTPEMAVEMFRRAIELGVDELVICATSGHETPKEIYDLSQKVQKELNLKEEGVTLAFHPHTLDTTQGIQKFLAAILSGIFIIDSSILHQGGNMQGGKVIGNLTTEDIVFLLYIFGAKMGIDVEKFIEAVRFMRENLEEKKLPKNASLGFDILSKRERAKLRVSVAERAQPSSIRASNLKILGYSTYVGLAKAVQKGAGLASRITVKDKDGFMVPYKEFDEGNADEVAEVMFKYEDDVLFSFKRPKFVKENWEYQKVSSSTLTKTQQNIVDTLVALLDPELNTFANATLENYTMGAVMQPDGSGISAITESKPVFIMNNTSTGIPGIVKAFLPKIKSLKELYELAEKAFVEEGGYSKALNLAKKRHELLSSVRREEALRKSSSGIPNKFSGSFTPGKVANQIKIKGGVTKKKGKGITASTKKQSNNKVVVDFSDNRTVTATLRSDKTLWDVKISSSIIPTGGIDLTSIYDDLNIKTDLSGLPLPEEFQNIDSIKFEGFVPVIINIQPMPNLPVLLGFDNKNNNSVQSLAYSAIGPAINSLKREEM